MIVNCRPTGDLAFVELMMRSGAIMLWRSNGCTKKAPGEFARGNKRHEVAGAFRHCPHIQGCRGPGRRIYAAGARVLLPTAA